MAKNANPSVAGGIGAVLGLVLFGACAAGVFHNDADKPVRPTSSSVETVTHSTSSDDGIGPGALQGGLGSADPPTTAAETPMVAWARSNGNDFGDLADEFHAAGDASANGDFAGVRAACRDLDNSQRRITAHLPSPDNGLNATLEELVSDVAGAASLCKDLDASTPQSVIDESTTLITKAGAELETATRILQTYKP